MSILINGMDMPKNGRVTIELASEETGTNILARITDDKTGKLIEHKGVVVIPTPHGRLIDADELLKTIEANDYMLRSGLNTFDRGMFTLGTQQAIDKAPTIIEAEE